MKLRYITMSDPREDLPIIDTLNLLRSSPIAELGVQCHPSAMSVGKSRNIWFNKMLDTIDGMQISPNIALHVNYEWCDDLCTGKIPGEISGWINRKHAYTNIPLINRIQLNIGDYAAKFDPQKLSDLFAQFATQEFILVYNQDVASKIDDLRKTGTRFKLLFDSSYGTGRHVGTWQAPVYPDIQFGYSGGISPEYVKHNLNNISKILPKDYQTWIDAEGRLRSPQTGGMDLQRAQMYLHNATQWQK